MPNGCGFEARRRWRIYAIIHHWLTHSLFKKSTRRHVEFGNNLLKCCAQHTLSISRPRAFPPSNQSESYSTLPFDLPSHVARLQRCTHSYIEIHTILNCIVRFRRAILWLTNARKRKEKFNMRRKEMESENREISERVRFCFSRRVRDKTQFSPVQRVQAGALITCRRCYSDIAHKNEQHTTHIVGN